MMMMMRRKFALMIIDNLRIADDVVDVVRIDERCSIYAGGGGGGGAT